MNRSVRKDDAETMAAHWRHQQPPRSAQVRQRISTITHVPRRPPTAEAGVVLGRERYCGRAERSFFFGHGLASFPCCCKDLIQS